MEKEVIKTKIEAILNAHNDEVSEILSNGFNIDIRLEKDKPAKIIVAKDIDTTGRGGKAGIRIKHDGQTDDFSSQEALLFSIKQIGYERFYNAQKKSKVIDRDRPTNVKNSEIVELKDDNGLWYVNMHSGINQRVGFLNNIFNALSLDWTAERWN